MKRMFIFLTSIALALTATTVSAQCPGGLVLHMPFTAGSMADVCGHLSTNNDVVPCEDKDGVPDSAALFNGTSGGLTFEHTTDFDLTEYTLFAHIRVDVLQETQAILYAYRLGVSPFNGVFALGIGQDGRIWFTTVAETAQYGIDSQPISVGEWFSVACTFNKSTGLWQLFVNGELDNFAIGCDGCPTTPFEHSLLVGYYGDDAPYFFHGAIDDIRIYDRVLSTEEIRELSGLPLDWTAASTVDSPSEPEGDTSSKAINNLYILLLPFGGVILLRRMRRKR